MPSVFSPLQRRPVLHGLWVAFVSWCLLAAPLSHATTTLRLGVLASSGTEETVRTWEPTARYLAKTLGDVEVEVVGLRFAEINEAVRKRTVQLVLTDPEHYVALRASSGLEAMATLRGRAGGQIVDTFGSVVFTRADLTDIRGLRDVRDRRVAAVGLYSVAGFLLAADALLDQGIHLRGNDVASLEFTDVPHSQVVDLVMAGKADVGIVRTGVLESLVEKGQLKLADIRVLGQRPKHTFPQLLSTEMAPEWPIAAVGIDDTLRSRLRRALVDMPPDGAEAKASRHAGFSDPANYAAVAEMMQRLRVVPDMGFFGSVRSLWVSHQTEVGWILLVLTVLGLGITAVLWRANRRLRRLTALYSEAQHDLQVTAAAFDSQVGLLISDSQTRILRVNRAFVQIFGFSEEELRGKSTAVLRSTEMPAGRMAAIWAELQANGHWEGELAGQRSDGSPVPCLVTIAATRTVAGDRGFVGTFIDMSQHYKDQREIRRLAFFDVLTGLPNRRLFMERLNEGLEVARHTGSSGALTFVDLDHFKMLNDSQGHAVGDELLREVAHRLSRVASADRGLVARLGGDEFVVMLVGLPADPAAALRKALSVADALREAILQPFQLARARLHDPSSATLSHVCSGSLGVTLFDAQDRDVIEVMRRADVAMYQSKHAGRNMVRAFDSAFNEQLSARATLMAELSEAIQRGELELHYQPEVNERGQMVAAESLVRWRHPRHGDVPPSHFIPLAEEAGTIVALGDWVVEAACRTLVRWSHHPQLRDIRLSINVSPRQFIEADFAEKLEASLQRSGARGDRLMLEITESFLMENAARVVQVIRRLRRMGIEFALDDFGTGYSSMAYLQQLPLRQLKIDGGFIQALGGDAHSHVIVRAMIGLGRSMGLTVVAEGVETERQREIIHGMGAELVQGFHLGRPLPLDAFEASILAP